jgi:hypothetical protein
MKSGNEPALALKRLSHRCVAFSIPALFMATTLFFAHDISTDFSPPGFLFWIPILAGGILALALSGIFHAERAGSLAPWRALALTLLAVYALRLPFRLEPFPERLAPDAASLFALACVAVQWVWSLGIERLFLDRESFIQGLGELDGTALSVAMREDGLYLSETTDGLRKIALSVTISAALLVILLLVGFLNHAEPSLPTLVFFVAFFLLVLLVYALFRIYNAELYFAGFGLRGAFSLTHRRIFFALLLLAACLTIAIIVSSDSAILPPTVFAYLLALLKRIPRPDIPVNMDELPPSEPDNSGDLLHALKEADFKPIIDLGWLVNVLKIVFLAALVVGLVWFLFGPFFAREWGKFWKAGRFRRHLVSWLASLKDLFSWMLNSGKRDKTRPPVTRSRSIFADSVKNRLRPGKSPEKKREIGRLTRQFLRIVDWGDARGLGWRPSAAPLEYARALALAVPQIERDVMRAANLFEKALYAAELLEPAEESAFILAVDAVTKVSGEAHPDAE